MADTLPDHETLLEQGREVGRAIQESIRRNKQGALEPWKEQGRAKVSRFKGRAKTIDTDPDLLTFVQKGGMRAIEYAVGVRAAEEAIKFERQLWLPTLERWIKYYDDDFIRAQLRKEIKRLRRCLGIKQELTLEERRAQTRERVRKHRQRKQRDPRGARS